MNRIVAIAALVALSTPAVAQSVPDPRDFYFCASFYRWFGSQLPGEAPLKEHVSRSVTLFDAGAVALTDGIRTKEMVEGSSQRLGTTVERGRKDNLTLGELFKVVDGECWSQQRQHGAAILAKISQVSAAQQPFFELGLPNGQVPPVDIASRAEAVRKRPDAQVGDQKEVVIYSFERRLGDKSEIVHHVVTKEMSPAHPAIIFMRLVREGQGRPPVVTFAGSFGGSKDSYDKLYQAFVVMNTAR